MPAGVVCVYSLLESHYCAEHGRGRRTCISALRHPVSEENIFGRVRMEQAHGACIN